MQRCWGIESLQKMCTPACRLPINTVLHFDPPQWWQQATRQWVKHAPELRDGQQLCYALRSFRIKNIARHQHYREKAKHQPGKCKTTGAEKQQVINPGIPPHPSDHVKREEKQEWGGIYLNIHGKKKKKRKPKPKKTPKQNKMKTTKTQQKTQQKTPTKQKQKPQQKSHTIKYNIL